MVRSGEGGGESEMLNMECVLDLDGPIRYLIRVRTGRVYSLLLLFLSLIGIPSVPFPLT